MSAATRRRARRTRPPLDLLAAVAVGGALGSLARYGLAELLPRTDGAFPTATLVVNLVGSFVLGVVLSVLLEERAPRHLRPLLAVGVIGSFTTFSSFVVQTVQLVTGHHLGTAASYFAASVLAGLAAARAGVAIASATVPYPRTR